MIKLVKIEKPLFIIKSVLGKQVRTHPSYWNKIINQKHPEANLNIKHIKETLSQSDCVYQSQHSKNIYLYTKKFKQQTIIVVVKHLNSDGFIITSYKTDKLLTQPKIWPK